MGQPTLSPLDDLVTRDDGLARPSPLGDLVTRDDGSVPSPGWPCYQDNASTHCLSQVTWSPGMKGLHRD